MNRQLLLLLWRVARLGCLAGYGYALMDWVLDYKTELYERHHGEAFLETSALVTYTVLGIRFLTKRINLF